MKERERFSIGGMGGEQPCSTSEANRGRYYEVRALASGAAITMRHCRLIDDADQTSERKFATTSWPTPVRTDSG
jgi:hypothetical protein